jgi:hypothetical protein
LGIEKSPEDPEEGSTGLVGRVGRESGLAEPLGPVPGHIKSILAAFSFTVVCSFIFTVGVVTAFLAIGGAARATTAGPVPAIPPVTPVTAVTATSATAVIAIAPATVAAVFTWGSVVSLFLGGGNLFADLVTFAIALGEGGGAAEADAAFFVNTDTLDPHLVAHGADVLNTVDAEISQLGDVDEAFLAGETLDEGTEVLHAADGTVVEFAFLDLGGDHGLDFLEGAVHGGPLVA